MRPYFADVIKTISPGLHVALNVSQLQNSLSISKHRSEMYLSISSLQFVRDGFPCLSYVSGMHLPRRILPYLAVDIITTSPGLQWALKVSQLQYSLGKSVHEIRYLKMSSIHPITEGSPEASYVSGTHLPSFILPYFVVVINTNWSGWHWAVKVSQLQYSRCIPNEKKYLSVCAMPVSFSFLWLASAYLQTSKNQISLFSVARLYWNFTWLCLQNIQLALGFLSYHRTLVHICHAASVHTWLTSWVPLGHGYSLLWRFPSYSSPWVYLNDKGTLLCLRNIRWDQGFRCRRTSVRHICQLSSVHSVQMSSEQLRLSRKVPWMSPSCNTLFGDLN